MVPPVEVSFFLGPGLLHYQAPLMTTVITTFVIQINNMNLEWRFNTVVYMYTD